MILRSFALATAVLAVTSSAALASATLQYPGGRTFLLVNEQGHLNGFVEDLNPMFPNPLPVISSPGAMGLFYDGVGDGTVDGCLCEGWGAGALFGGNFVSMGASVDNGGISGMAPLVSFGATNNTASSIVNTAGGELTVRHNIGPSIVFDVFQMTVTITNNTMDVAEDVLYRRIMDWDINPTPFDEFVTIQGVEANLAANGGNVHRAVDNGFDPANPGNGQLTPINEPINTDFHDSGPNDHGAGFDFVFGDLDPGESRSFNIFYGAAPSQGIAEAAVNTLGLDVWSFGQSNPLGLPFDGGPCGSDDPPDGCFSDGDGGGDFVLEVAGGPSPAAVPGEANPIGEPATFLFGFQGVGGVAPGETAETPLLPIDPIPDDNIFEFENPEPRLWYDPPFVDSYTYELVGDPMAFFTEVGVPPAGFGFGPIDLEIGGMVVETLLPGEIYDFFANGYMDVQFFELSGISPLIDAGAPGFATAFPTFLDFTGSPTLFRMTAIVAPTASVPEPGILVLFGAGFVGLVALRRRR